MRKLSFLIVLLISLVSFSDLFASSSIRNYPYTRDVFRLLSNLPSQSIPGLVQFRYGETFDFIQTPDTDCRMISANGILRKLADYLDALNELDRETIDSRLFNEQMALVLGSGPYLVCEKRSLIGDQERVDTFFFDRNSDYRLWITETFQEL